MMASGKLTKARHKSSGNIDEVISEEVFDKNEKNTRRRPATTSGGEVGPIKSAAESIWNEESFESRDSVVYPSTAPEVRRSVDVVVVDVHNERKRSETNVRTRKVSKERNNGDIDYKIDRSSNRKEKPRKSFDKAWEDENTVVEFEDANKILEINSINHSRVPNSPEGYQDYENFGSKAEFLASSAENSEAKITPDVNKIFGQPKHRRKRWSKNENNLHLTHELLAHSSDTNHSGQSVSHVSKQRGFRPVPAPRRIGVSNSFDYESTSAFDNTAFNSETEEVLRIETEVYEPQESFDGSQNYRQRTKIEMTNFYDSYKEENEGISKIYTLADTSDELETQAHELKKGEGLFTPIKRKGQTESENSLLSEDVQVFRPNLSDDWNQKEKRLRENHHHSKPESISFNTDINVLPRSKPDREFFKKSKSQKRRDSGHQESVQRRRSKHIVKRSEKNMSYAESSRDLDLIEYNVDKVMNFVSVTIHKSDVLETDFVTRHPMVKVHIVDMKTGNYLKSMGNGNDRSCGYLQPMITSKFDFKQNRSIVPNWEEELIFEYNFNEVIQTQQVLIFFEILDLLNFAEASFKYNLLGNEGCWHKIAWAFLRPVGVDGTLHINKKLRLQLYLPTNSSKKSGRFVKCEVFNWWRSTYREKYPSTLYITLKSVDPPIEEPLIYERFSFNDLREVEDESRESCKKSSDLLQLPKWDRLLAQSCKIPNNHLFQTKTFDNGSFYLTFSNNGKYLACVGSEEGNYPIVVYTISEGKMSAQFNGHTNFVYGLNWSTDDKYLLSVSSDQTACIWDMGNKIIQHTNMLPHPSYVYCGKFYPANKNVVITGCYDGVLRVWIRSKSRKSYELTQELCEHKGYVNSLCFKKNGGLITADSLGVIILWSLKKTGRTCAREWHVSTMVKNNEIENIVINTIILHPLGSRLLVHSRDNGLRIIDLSTGVVLQRYKGLRNRRLQTTACLSPCGSLVLCGGEDSYLTIWNLENGSRLAKYFVQNAKIISCVAYHPFDHIMAFSTFGNVSGVQIMNFDKNATGENVGLNLLADNDVAGDTNEFEITMKFDKTDFVPRDTRRGMKVTRSTKNTLNLCKSSRKSVTEVNGRGRKASTEINRNTMNDSSVSRQELLKLKIQWHNECKEDLKSRSAARLNNIIQKIDKILVNTSTLKRDLDSTCSSNDVCALDTGQFSASLKKGTIENREDELRSRSWNGISKNSATPNINYATMEPYNASREFIQMQDIGSGLIETSGNEKSTNSEQRLLRLRSRSNTATDISLNSEAETGSEENVIHKSSGNASFRDNEFVKANSETETNAQRKSRDKIMERLPAGSSEEKTKSISNNDTCIVVLENSKDDTNSDPSTINSTGTYIVDRDKSVKPSTSDIRKFSSTTSSVDSSATFTIENEIVPKTTSKSKSRLSRKTDLGI